MSDPFTPQRPNASDANAPLWPGTLNLLALAAFVALHLAPIALVVWRVAS